MSFANFRRHLLAIAGNVVGVNVNDHRLGRNRSLATAIGEQPGIVKLIQRPRLTPLSIRPGKVVLITGASGGIEQSLAAEFSRAGTTVVISSRNEEKLRTLAEQLRRDGGQTLPLRCDVAEREQVYALCAMIAKQIGTVQILINSAGIGAVMV